MRKITATTVTMMLIIGLLTTMIPLFVLNVTAADSGPSSYFIEYSSGYGSATVNVPSIGNITSMTVIPIHQDKSSTIDNYDVLSLQLTSPRALGTMAASISTNPMPDDIAWRKALRNGSSTYTEVNGNVVINNLLRVTASELKIQANGTRLSVDFSPINPVVVTLPPSLFPASNFSATWTVPAFHMDFVGNGTLILGNSTSTNPSGWSEFNDYTYSQANFTFQCPSWNNYTATGTNGQIRQFNTHRGAAPTGAIPATDPAYAIFAGTGGGITNADIPKTGNITQISINAEHNELSTMGTYDEVLITLSAAGFNGSVEAGFHTGGSAVSAWVGKYSDIMKSNSFQVSPNELKVQRNGTHLTVDFNPANPISVTLPASVFPSGSFPATWTMPAFHTEFDAVGRIIAITGFTELFRTNWFQAVTAVATPPTATNATFTIPSMNYTTTGTATRLIPYIVRTVKSPDSPAASVYCSVTVLRGWTWWFFAQGTGVGPLTYQWYEGTTPLQGQTSMVLPITKTTNGVYTYYCTVTDANGNTAISNTVTLTVLG